MNLKKLFLSLIIVVYMVTPGYLKIFAKSYKITKIDIYAKIQTDGSMQIQETRTYQFKGSFSWADYQLPLQGIGQVQYFSLKDDFQDYTQSSDQSPRSYYIQQDDQNFYVRWFYEARNESKTFTLNYTVTDAVTCYQDVTEFYYKFIGSGNTKEIDEVTVMIQLPDEATFPEVRSWAHGPLWGDVEFNNGRIVMAVNSLPARQYWEARVTFPTDWITEEVQIVQQEKLPIILQEEDNWAQQANQRREAARQQYEFFQERKSQAFTYSIFLSMLGFLGLLFLYLKYGTAHRVNFNQDISSELPQNEPPAISSTMLFNKQVYGAALTATLFDLARRGYLKIEQEGLPEKKWWGTKPPEFSLQRSSPESPQTKLLDFEENLLTFIFEDLGAGNARISFKTFKKNRTKVQRWFQKWRKIILGHLKELKYYDPASVRATVYGVILSLVVTGLGVLILLQLGEPGIIAIIAGSLFLGLAFLILRCTPEVKLRRKKLAALKNYLKKYYFMKEANRQGWLENIESYLVYGIALGLAKKDIEKIMVSVPADQQTSYFPWYYSPAGAYSSPATFATAVSTMVSIASSTVSSSTGSGGGASSGGGGGGGGASGGAG
jgi:uncharacterized membrane protein